MRRMTDDLRAQLKQAYALIKAGDNAAAAALLKPICRANPENVDAWWLLSFALTDENHIRLALEQILKVNPQHEQARQRLEKLTPREETAAESFVHEADAAPKSRTWMLLLVVPIVVIFAAAAGVLLLSGGEEDDDNQDARPTVQSQVVQTNTSVPVAVASLPATWTPSPSSTVTATRTATQTATATVTPTPTITPTATETASTTPTVGATPQPVEIQENIMLWRGENPITALAWSPDGKTLASGGTLGTVILWDAETWSDENQLVGGQGVTHSVAWSPDGRLLASGHESRTFHVWNVAEKVQVVRFEFEPLRVPENANVLYLDWSPDGKNLVSNDDFTWRVWEVPPQGTVTQEAQIGIPSFNYPSAEWSPDGQFITLINWTDTGARVDFWNPATGEILFSVGGHESRIWDYSWSPDGSLLATGGPDGVIVTEVASQTALYRIQNDPPVEARSVGWSPDGEYLAVADFTDTVRIYQMTPHGAILRWTYVWPAVMTRLRWSPDSRLLAIGGEEQGRGGILIVIAVPPLP